MRLISSVTQQASTCLSSILDRSIERVNDMHKMNTHDRLSTQHPTCLISRPDHVRKVCIWVSTLSIDCTAHEAGIELFIVLESISYRLEQNREISLRYVTCMYFL
jgi:hypothetical protein